MNKYFIKQAMVLILVLGHQFTFSQDKPKINLIFKIDTNSFIVDIFPNEVSFIEEALTDSLIDIMSHHIGFVDFTRDDTLPKQLEITLLPEIDDIDDSEHFLEYKLSIANQPDIIHLESILESSDFLSLGESTNLVFNISNKVRKYLISGHNSFSNQLFGKMELSSNLLYLQNLNEWVLPFKEDALWLDTDASSFRIKVLGDNTGGPCEFNLTATYRGPYFPSEDPVIEFLNCIRAGSNQQMHQQCDHKKYIVFIKEYVRKLGSPPDLTPGTTHEFSESLEE